MDASDFKIMIAVATAMLIFTEKRQPPKRWLTILGLAILIAVSWGSRTSSFAHFVPVEWAGKVIALCIVCGAVLAAAGSTKLAVPDLAAWKKKLQRK